MLKILLSTLLLLSLNSFAATQNGVTLPDSLKIAGQDLVLNGIGTRKATFLRIKVYVGGLYLKQKSSDYTKFLSNDEPKHIIMKFVRSVDADDMQDGWQEAFENAVKDRKPIEKEIKKFLSLMPDMKEGEEMKLTFLKDGLETMIKGKKLEKISGKKFSDAVLSVWFINASDKGLKKGFLGL